MKIHKLITDLFSRPLVLGAAALVLGITAGSEYRLFGMVTALCLTGLSIFGIMKAKDPGIRVWRIFIFIVTVFFFFMGLIRIRDCSEIAENIPEYDSACKGAEVKGKVSDISFSGERYLITVTDTDIKLKNETLIATESDDPDDGYSTIIYADELKGISIGDGIYSKGTLYSFSEATNFGQFDQRKYYYAKSIYYKLYADEIEIVSEKHDIRDDIKNLLFNVSLRFQQGLGTVFDPENKGILSAMLTGNRSELDEKTKEVYQRIGIAHVLSISGLHITMIGMAVFGLLLKITGHLRFSVIISVVLLFLYGLLTGFSVSTVRAVIMLTVLLMGRVIGKSYDGQSAAALAATVILISNPLELFESGFQLSFLAVFGIFAGNEIRNNLKIKSKVLIYLIPALSALISTFPVILGSFYSFSAYSLIANLILLPFMGIIVVFGFISGIFGALSLSCGTGVFMNIGMIAGGPADFFLKLYSKVSSFLLNLKGSDIITGSPGFVPSLIYYMLIFLLVYLSALYYEHRKMTDFKPVNLKKDICIKIFSFLTLVSLMFFVLLYRTPGQKLLASNLDVGQGLCVYIEAGGTCILADGGSSNVKNVGKYRIEPFLLWNGVSELEYCFVSHTDEDHISGIREIIEDGRIVIRNLVFGSYTGEDDPLVILAEKNGINVMFLSAGDEIQKEEDGEKLEIKVLSPEENTIYEDKNQASLVLRLQFEDFSMLITGDSDIYSEAEYVKMLKDEESISVLECPHHGSKYSCSDLLLNTVKPKVTVISCSKHNTYGHPSADTLERLAKTGSSVYSTPDCGMVNIRYYGSGKFGIKAFKQQNQKNQK